VSPEGKKYNFGRGVEISFSDQNKDPFPFPKITLHHSITTSLFSMYAVRCISSPTTKKLAVIQQGLSSN
jgi:hypothetical protein